MMSDLILGGCTYSWLNDTSLYGALEGLAEVGFTVAELTTSAPHLQSAAFGAYERAALRRRASELGLRFSSVNPGFMDINMLSPNNEFRELSIKIMESEMELASDLEASVVVAIPGRRHALVPMPDADCRWWLEKALERLVSRAEALGVILGLEVSPYGYLGKGSELLEIADAYDSPHLGIVYDAANVLNTEDPADGVRSVASRLVLAHVSDTWREKWAHTSIGRGEVDFAGYAAALAEVGYNGPTIYELADLEPALPRLHSDVELLEKAGWRR
jgi:sugar phosphate isomerase/epimerase